MSNDAGARLALEPLVSPWASEAELDSFFRGETPPELRDYLAAGFSEHAARQARAAGVPADMLRELLRA